MNKSILKGSWSCRAKCTAGRRTIGATKIITTKTTTTTRTNGLASLFARSQTETKQLLVNCWFQINLFSVTCQFGQPGIIMYCHLNFPRPAPIWPYSSVGRATVICYGDRGFESHQDQRFFFSFSVWALSPPQRLRKRDRENRARGGSSTFPEISARSPFSSPVLQYIYCSRLLSSRLPLKNSREPLRRREVWAYFLSRAVAQKVLFEIFIPSTSTYHIYTEHFNVPYLSHFICLIVRPNLTGYPSTYVFICRKLPS